MKQRSWRLVESFAVILAKIASDRGSDGGLPAAVLPGGRRVRHLSEGRRGARCVAIGGKPCGFAAREGDRSRPVLEKRSRQRTQPVRKCIPGCVPRRPG